MLLTYIRNHIFVNFRCWDPFATLASSLDLIGHVFKAADNLNYSPAIFQLYLCLWTSQGAITNGNIALTEWTTDYLTMAQPLFLHKVIYPIGKRPWKPAHNQARRAEVSSWKVTVSTTGRPEFGDLVFRTSSLDLCFEKSVNTNSVVLTILSTEIHVVTKWTSRSTKWLPVPWD